MSALIFLIPVSIALGGLGLAVFCWAFRTGQYEDVAGASERIFLDEDDKPL
ncbi:MAG TPA: cbb3-type cytochrome oxidase assembly protein CcoS [Devosia sp.]|jgi:cbb3-type cytochrome oxidase maturation protein|nr:cbb3-type cytochrome oxidase assembly protein CcoS [Devosia sp.]